MKYWVPLSLLAVIVLQLVLLFGFNARLATVEKEVQVMKMRAAQLPGGMPGAPGMPGMEGPGGVPGGRPVIQASGSPMDMAVADIFARLIQLDESPGLALSTEKRGRLRAALEKYGRSGQASDIASVEQAFDALVEGPQRQLLQRMQQIRPTMVRNLLNRAALGGTSVVDLVVGYLQRPPGEAPP